MLERRPLWTALVALAVACVAAVLAHEDVGATIADLVDKLVKQNSTFESFLKNTGYFLNYLGLVTKGELSLRLTSLVATGCSYGTLWTKWPNPNWFQIALQSGLLLRACRVTWKVVLKSMETYSFSEKELALYTAHFENHGLSHREFHALLKAGAEWRTAKVEEVIQEEGQPVRTFMLLFSGKCAVSAGDTVVSTLGPGELIGESSFARRCADTAEPRTPARKSVAGADRWASLGRHVRTRASATVTAVGPVEYVAWPITKLEQQQTKNSSVKACLMTITASALAEKLRRATKKIDALSRRESSGSFADLLQAKLHHDIVRKGRASSSASSACSVGGGDESSVASDVGDE